MAYLEFQAQLIVYPNNEIWGTIDRPNCDSLIFKNESTSFLCTIQCQWVHVSTMGWLTTWDHRCTVKSEVMSHVWLWSAKKSHRDYKVLMKIYNSWSSRCRIHWLNQGSGVYWLVNKPVIPSNNLSLWSGIHFSAMHDYAMLPMSGKVNPFHVARDLGSRKNSPPTIYSNSTTSSFLIIVIFFLFF